MHYVPQTADGIAKKLNSVQPIFLALACAAGRHDLLEQVHRVSACVCVYAAVHVGIMPSDNVGGIVQESVHDGKRHQQGTYVA